MAIVQPRDEEPPSPSQAPYVPFPTTSLIEDNQLLPFITDFFDWLETEWQLPLFAPETPRNPLPHPLDLTDSLYTVEDLVRLYGYSASRTHNLLDAHGIAPHSYVHPGGRAGRHALFTKQDLAPVIEHWEWERLLSAIDDWWQRFFPPACRTCLRCRANAPYSVATQQFFCAQSIWRNTLRSVFTHFIRELSRLRSVSAWWHEHRTDTWRGKRCSAWGILFIYFLDRRLLQLSIDELLHLDPLCNRSHQELIRLWRHRRPEEYAQFLHALDLAHYHAESRDRVFSVLSLLVLLKYGLSGIKELGQALSQEELEQCCREHRLVTRHIAEGVFLPYPLGTDIRRGHVVLDDIRFYFWQYAAGQEQPEMRQHWDQGPRNWTAWLVKMIELALTAPVYEGAVGILSRRPETERVLVSPWRLAQEGKAADTGFALLPRIVQEQIMTYLTHCHQELRLELSSLRTRAQMLVRFFTWVRRQEKLTTYPHWTREFAQGIFRAYASGGCPEILARTRRARLQGLAHFFSTLAKLELPVPAGYHLLSTLEKGELWQLRKIPHEEILDRVFQEGVRRLTYDPFARLALTIHYYCGTRTTETCDLHLFCILEDRDGHAYLLIPRGKAKQERPFPIVELGMGPLLEYMDEVIKLRLAPDGTSRTLGQTNFRYLEDDPERAMDWQYLFDRVPGMLNVKHRGRLSTTRVAQTLQEAVLITAKRDPSGLFQPETYQPVCSHRRRKGQRCLYFAAQEGITLCPRCRSTLSGLLGARCRHTLEADFVCDGVAQNGELFCPKCDSPLADFVPITTHVFRHNSVSRAHRAGVSVAQNMRLHGHQTLPMHLRYLHLLLEDTTNEVRQIFAEKRLRDVRQLLGTTSGKIVEGGIAYTVSLEQYLGLTLQRSLKRRTYGIWGGFWAGALAQRGIASPLSVEDEIVIPEDTYEHTIAQYWYEALGLAVSEVAFEHVTNKKWRAEVPPFLDRQRIEALVQLHLHHIVDSLDTALGQRLMETDILEQRRFLDDLAEKLRPWWQHLGAIDQLVEMFAPGGGHAFQKQLPPTELAP